MKLSLILCSVLLTANLVAQDIIKLTDSTTVIAQSVHIDSTAIRYKMYNYENGPLIIKSISEVAYITYANGERKIITKPARQAILNKEKHQSEIGDYIKFNLQLAGVVYNSFSNVPRNDNEGKTYSDKYKKVNSQQNVSCNIGLNFIFGKSPYIKHLIGVNYLRTQGEFIFDHSNFGYSNTSRFKSIIDFINVTSGLRFTIANKIHIDPLVSLNIVAHSKTTESGTETYFNAGVPANTQVTTSFENRPTYTRAETTVSLSPKIAYAISTKNQKAEIFYSYTIALGYRLPWNFIGFAWYPFKKLR